MTDCAVDALDAGEPLAGTAPLANAWIVIEQPGPWGRDAVADSHLPDAVAAHLTATEGTGVKVVLARHPDRPERSVGPERHVWVARTAPGGVLLRHGLMADLAEVTCWDLSAIGEGSLPGFGRVDTRPVHFICTNGSRDRCCAVAGRALLARLLDSRPAATALEERATVWECSHVGGHRFSPVLLSLPSGAVHGRLDVAAAESVVGLADRGEVLLDSYRGRSGLLPAFQVAAIEVRAQLGIADVEAIDVLRLIDGRAVPVPPGIDPLADADDAVAEIRHRDGRAWQATLTRVPLTRPRLESCGKGPVAAHRWTCSALEPVAAWTTS